MLTWHLILWAIYFAGAMTWKLIAQSACLGDADMAPDFANLYFTRGADVASDYGVFISQGDDVALDLAELIFRGGVDLAPLYFSSWSCFRNRLKGGSSTSKRHLKTTHYQR